MAVLVAAACIRPACSLAELSAREAPLELSARDFSGKPVKPTAVFRAHPGASASSSRTWLNRLPVVDVTKPGDLGALKPGYYRLDPALGCLLKTTKTETRPNVTEGFSEEPDEPYRFNVALIRKDGSVLVCAAPDDVRYLTLAPDERGDAWFRLVKSGARAAADFDFERPVKRVEIASFVDERGASLKAPITRAYGRELVRSDSGELSVVETRLLFGKPRGGVFAPELKSVQVRESDVCAVAESNAALYPSESGKPHWADTKLIEHLDTLPDPLRGFAKSLHAGGDSVEAARRKLESGPDKGLLKQLMAAYGGHFRVSQADLGIDPAAESCAYRRVVRQYCAFDVAPAVNFSVKPEPLSSDEVAYYDALVDLLPDLKPGTDPAYIVSSLMYRYEIPVFDMNRGGARMRVEHSPEGWQSIGGLLYPQGHEKEALEALRTELKLVIARAKSRR